MPDPQDLPDADEPSPEDPNRAAPGGNAPLDAGPNAAPGNPTGSDESSLPPGSSTKEG